MHADLSFYDLLGVEPTASLPEIRAAYRANLAKYHPDVNSAPNATRLTALLNEAWDTLRNPHKRAAYDATFRRTGSNTASEADPPPPPPPPPPRPRPDPMRSTPPKQSAEPNERRVTAARQLIGWLGIIGAVICAYVGDGQGADYNGGFVLLFWVGVFGGGYLVRNANRASSRAATRVAWIAAVAPGCVLSIALLALLGGQPQSTQSPRPSAPFTTPIPPAAHTAEPLDQPIEQPIVHIAQIGSKRLAQHSDGSSRFEESHPREEMGRPVNDENAATAVVPTVAAVSTDEVAQPQPRSLDTPPERAIAAARIDRASIAPPTPFESHDTGETAHSLIGKTESQVMVRLGPPSLPTNGTWYYDGVGITVRIYFRNGVVSGVAPDNAELRKLVRVPSAPVAAPPPPAGAIAQCGDGLYVFSEHVRGTCYGHGGVARRLDK